MRSRIAKGFTYADVWPLLYYSSALHEQMEDFADPNNTFSPEEIRELAQKALQKASSRPGGPSTPISWVRQACTNKHVWDELLRWKDEDGWRPAKPHRNNAGRPLCPECGEPDSPKARRILGIKR